MSRGRSATAARIAALEVLRAVRTGSFADPALDRALRALPPGERGWTQELVYGTLRLRGRIDYLLERFVRGGLARLDADVLDVLRLGAYQLLEMSSVPPYAAVSQSVELARDAGSARAAGLVNGVLQSLGREADRVAFPDPAAEPIAHLEHHGSHPRWLVERWVERWGAETAGALVEANNRRPELYLRPVGVEVATAIEHLRAAGVEAVPVPFAPDSVRVSGATDVASLLAVVPAIVQDPAAALVVRYAAIPADARVLDVCAAPGGKAIAIGASSAYVAAADLSFRRLRRLRESVARLGLQHRVGPVAADGRAPPFRPQAAVLLDAPCTGTGTLRRHPDGRWRVTEAALAQLVRLQAELLDAAAAVVAPDGLLVYSTCSLEREENEHQVEAFLRRHADFELEPAPGAVDTDLLDEGGCLTVLPQRQGVDGSFAARLRRRG